MIYCFIIRSSKQRELFKFMQTDSREQPVSSINEMLERDFLFYMLESPQEQVHNLPRVFER